MIRGNPVARLTCALDAMVVAGQHVRSTEVKQPLATYNGLEVQIFCEWSRVTGHIT